MAFLYKQNQPRNPAVSVLPFSSNIESTPTRILVNSLPKSGTHLLKKVVELLGINSTDIHISKNLVRNSDATSVSSVFLPAGVDWPESVSSDIVRNHLCKVPERGFASAHMPFSKTFSEIVEELKIKTLLILRDPRDVVVSMANYVPNDPAHFLYSFYQGLNEEQRITLSIVGFKPVREGEPGLFTIAERWRKVVPWMDQDYNYTTFFERLVGPHGGGNLYNQYREISKIAKHIGLDEQTVEVNQIAKRVFGGTTTFRKGRIGTWRQKFTTQHKRVFKKIAGDILIRWGYERDYDW